MTIIYSKTVNCRVDPILHGWFDVHLHVGLWRFLSGCAARTQRSPSAQRIIYSLRKSLLCMNSNDCRTVARVALWAVCVCVCAHENQWLSAWPSNRFSMIDRLNAGIENVAMCDDDRTDTSRKNIYGRIRFMKLFLELYRIDWNALVWYEINNCLMRVSPFFPH